MNKNEVVIATITWAREEAEEEVLKASLRQLAALQIRVVITDGGSTNSFLQFLKSIPQFTVQQSATKGAFAQARQSIKTAAGTNASHIFYTEPDKESFFSNGILAMIETAHTETGVLLAARTQKSFSSFPPFQQMTETAINNCCAELMQKKADYCYGPFLFNKKIVSFLNALPEDIGWGWRPYLFNVAHRLNYPLSFFEDDFYCPSGQQTDDATERIYRMKQLEQNIRGLVLSTATAL